MPYLDLLYPLHKHYLTHVGKHILLLKYLHRCFRMMYNSEQFLFSDIQHMNIFRYSQEYHSGQGMSFKTVRFENIPEK